MNEGWIECLKDTFCAYTRVLKLCQIIKQT